MTMEPSALPPYVVRAIGTIAHRALTQSAGWAQPLAEFPDAPYLRASGEIIWVGRARSGAASMHPRMVLVDSAIERGCAARFELARIEPWQPQRVSLASASAQRFVQRTRQLAQRAAEIGAPSGFGLLLVGMAPAFPLDRGAAHVRAVIGALERGDTARILRTAIPLIGLGPGLTPSGDDFLGGLMFGRRLIDGSARWGSLAAQLIQVARTRTHVISAALLADSLHGMSYARLHALVDSLSATSNTREHIQVARELTSIGHSSGWDVLTGFIVGVTGHLSEELRNASGAIAS